MKAVNPYLNFNGDAEEAFSFYKSVFGGEFIMLQRFKDVAAEHQTPAVEGEKIMHVALPLGSGNILMGSDVPSLMGEVKFGANFSISISTDSEEEAEKLFGALSAGGTVAMPLEKTFWGSYFGMVEDKFGVFWMISYDYEQHQSK